MLILLAVVGAIVYAYTFDYKRNRDAKKNKFYYAIIVLLIVVFISLIFNLLRFTI